MVLALNKTTLKQQRDQARIYRQFLPSLDLKRQQLLIALKKETNALSVLEADQKRHSHRVAMLHPLLGSSTVATRPLASLVQLRSVEITEENILGSMLPRLGAIDFHVASFSRWVTPFWIDALVEDLKRAAELRLKMQITSERVRRLSHAVERITQRVNLFEKVLIPRAEENIRKIVLFASDQERAAVVRSKIAKKKTGSASFDDQ